MSNTLVIDNVSLQFDPEREDSYSAMDALRIVELEEEKRITPVKRGFWRLVLDGEKFVVVRSTPERGQIRFSNSSFLTCGRVCDRPDIQEGLSQRPAESLFDLFVQKMYDRGRVVGGLVETKSILRDRELFWLSENLWSSKEKIEVPNFIKILLADRPIGRGFGDSERWRRIRVHASAGIQSEALRQGVSISSEEAWNLTDDPAFRTRNDRVILYADTRKPAVHRLPPLVCRFDEYAGQINCSAEQKEVFNDLPYKMDFTFNVRSKSGKRLIDLFGFK